MNLPCTKHSMSFIILDAEIPANRMRASLAAAGWHEVDTKSTSADFVYAEGLGLSNPRLYNVQSRLKCRLQSAALTDKARLHLALMGTPAADTVCETYAVSDDPAPTPHGENGPWIVRGSWGFAGRANIVVGSWADTRRAARTLMSRMRPKDRHSGAQVIASRYIDNPMLIDGRKFHVRINVIIVVREHGPPAAYAITGNEEAFLAVKRYKPSAYADPDIHDTHWVKEDEARRYVRRFPEEVPGGEELREAAHAILARVMGALIGQVTNYPEAQNGYEIFGADVMFDVEGRAKLIEFNFKPALRLAQGDGRDVETAIHNTVLAVAVDPVFGSDTSGMVLREDPELAWADAKCKKIY